MSAGTAVLTILAATGAAIVTSLITTLIRVRFGTTAMLVWAAFVLFVAFLLLWQVA